MAIIYKHKSSGEKKTVSFPWIWMITPLCAIDLLRKGFILRGLVGWIPLFTIVWMLQYKSIMDKHLRKEGYLPS